MPDDASTVPAEQVKELSELGDMHQHGVMAHHDPATDQHMSHDSHHKMAETSSQNEDGNEERKLTLTEQLKKLLANELINDYAKHSRVNSNSNELDNENSSEMPPSADSDEYEQFLSQLENQFAASGSRRFKQHGPRGF